VSANCLTGKRNARFPPNPDRDAVEQIEREAAIRQRQMAASSSDLSAFSQQKGIFYASLQYRTVFSILVWPSRISTVGRFPVTF
jgi:hypothetical protein